MFIRSFCSRQVSKSGFSTRQGQRQAWIIPAVMVGLPLILFWPLIVGGKVLFWGTSILQFYEWRLLAVEAYRAGQFPLWNTALGCGVPLLANLQSAALYPLNLIYFVFPVEQAMGYSVVLHVILAGCFTYGFTRHLGLKPTAALVSSLSYMFSGFIISRGQFLSMVNAAAWLPLLLWLTHRTVRRARLTDGLALGLTIAIQLLAGHAQLWYYSLWAVGLYGLFLNIGPAWRALRGVRSGHRQDADGAAWTGWAMLLLAFGVGILAAAGQALPTAEMTQVSQRSAGVDYDFAMNYSFWPWRLISLLAPDFFGNPAHGNFWGRGNYWEDCGYIGMLPLILGLIAVAIWLHQRVKGKGLSGRQDIDPTAHVPFFAVLCIAAILLALGNNLPIYPWVWRHIPGFGLFQAPARLLLWYTLGMAVLAGIGFDQLGTSERWARFSRYLMAIAGSVLLTAGAGWLFLSQSTTLSFLEALTRASILAVGSGILILLNTRWQTGSYRQVWSILAIGFIAADLLIFGWPLNPYADAGVYHQSSESGTFLREKMASDGQASRIFSFERFYNDTMFETFFRFKDFGPTDEAHLKTLREMLFPNLAIVEGLASANNYDPLVVGAQQDLLDQVETANEPESLKLLGLMGVRYIVGDGPGAAGRPVYSGEMDITENPYFLPRAYVTHQEVTTPNIEQEILRSAQNDRTEADARHPEQREGSQASPEQEILRSAQNDGGDGNDGAEADAVSLRDEVNRITMDVELDEPGHLVLADTYYPGWRVTVDGEEHAILRAHYALRAVALPAGAHRVVFAYDPLSFRLGLYISAATWLVAVSLWIFLVWKRGSRAEGARSNGGADIA